MEYKYTKFNWTKRKKVFQSKNGFEDLFYKNREIKDISVKTNLKVREQVIQQKGRPMPIQLQEQVSKEKKN